MSMTSDRGGVYKMIASCLATALVTGAMAYAAFGLDSNRAIAVLQSKQDSQEKLIEKMADTDAKLTQMLIEMREVRAADHADTESRLKALERGK